jgi:hypothetical protein
MVTAAHASDQAPWPTYAQFRQLALQRQWSIEWLAPYGQADHPTETVERILHHLAGTHWDHEPLPYPNLCQLYRAHRHEAPVTPDQRTCACGCGGVLGRNPKQQYAGDACRMRVQRRGRGTQERRHNPNTMAPCPPTSCPP